MGYDPGKFIGDSYMENRKLKNLATRTVKRLRLKFKSLPKNNEPSAQYDDHLYPIFEEPLQALAYSQVNKNVAFKCPLSYTVKLNGLSYGSGKWHPFVETIKEYMIGEITTYEGSILEAYYQRHQPENAAEAIVGFEYSPSGYHNLPPHLYRLAPWRADTVEQVDYGVKRFTKKDSRDHSDGDMTLETDGYLYHGPVSLRKGKLEYKRLIQTYSYLKKEGYKRELGYAHFLVLRRGNSYRYLSQGNGNHRTAAMVALGYETIPAVFQRSFVIDIKMAKYWPQVCNGRWTRKEAVAYFNHLFDFDSRAWATKKGLVLKNH